MHRTTATTRITVILLVPSLLLLTMLAACDSALLSGPSDGEDDTAAAPVVGGDDTLADSPANDGSSGAGSPAWDGRDAARPIPPGGGSSGSGGETHYSPPPITGDGTITLVTPDPPVDDPPIDVPPIDEPIIEPEPLPDPLPEPLPDPRPEPLPDPDPEYGSGQAGVLTAGTFDDNLNYEASMAFLRDAVLEAPDYKLPGITRGRRITIRVQNRGGEPIGGARVLVEAPDEFGQLSVPLLDMPTHSDGCVLYHTGVDGGVDSERCTVTVFPPDGSDPFEQIGDPAESTWSVTLGGAASVRPTRLDLAFVIDSTGSMSDELEYIKTEITGIVADVRRAFPDVDMRFALIVYRDAGDRYLTRVFDFTDDLELYQSDLGSQVASGGGDMPESMHLALADAVTLRWREADTARVMFLIADAPPHTFEAQRALQQVLALRNAGVAIYPVAASGVGLEAELIMRTAALLTLGDYVFLTDDSRVGNTHAQPHIPCYCVEHLDLIMTRVIESELAGRAIFPDPADAIRVVGRPLDGVCQDNPQEQ